MDPITQQTVLAAAGAGGDKVYVDDVFSTYLYDGTGAAKTITNGIDLAGEGGLVWLKSRNYSEAHVLSDTETGITKRHYSNSTTLQTVSNMITSANSDGFTLGTSNVTNSINSTNVSWTFRKAPGFFDVVTWSGNDTAGRTVAHNLGSVPGMIIVKYTGGTSDWRVYHRSTGNTKILALNTTNEAQTYSHWNNTTPTSTHFTLGDSSTVNGSGREYVAYVFAHDDASFGTDGDESIIKCGSYTGNGSSDGPEINLGFEPQWVMIKRTDYSHANSNWVIFDNMRGVGTGESDRLLSANSHSNEANFPNYVGNDFIEFNATGFKVIGGWSNIDDGNLIYMAIRRPHKPPEAATEVFAMDTGNYPTIPAFNSGFPVDLALMNCHFASRFAPTKLLYTYVNNSYANDANLTFDSNVGWAQGYNSNNLAYLFRRAPGFMDVTTYHGATNPNYAVQNIPHSLKVVPEMYITKGTDFSDNWMVYHKDVGNNKQLILSAASAPGNNAACWNSTSPTASVFTVGSDSATNRPGIYIAYLFATLPGISKVGSYTGSSGAVNVDCGFTNGARFVLIKRTDSSGGWYLFDTSRGILSGADTAIELQSALVTTGTDFIDPLSTGFTVTSSATAALNTSGGTYIFLAIA